jgi:hypothetical protein
MEQDLEVRALDERRRRETAVESRRGRKDEKGRCAVNAETGNGRSGDASPRQSRFVSEAVAVGGGKASKGSRCTAGNPVSRQEETQ